MSSLTSIKILELFKINYLRFFDELVELFPDESDIIIIRIFLTDQIPVQHVMDLFIERIIPIKDMVKNRNEKFFLEKCNLFDDLENGKVVHFKRLWNSPALDLDNKNVFWDYFDVLISLVEKYISLHTTTH